ncbi:MAG: hypothetical protein HRU09_08275 [Oligoflexales bacterium]|nr:hypothetical protein [Oligoflexales bacterium]
MGKVYLILVCISSDLFLDPAAFGKDRIILLPEPKHATPPTPDPGQSDKDLQKLRERRKKREGGSLSYFDFFQHKRDKKLAKAAGKQGPYGFLMQTTLVLPALSARGPRSNYTSELSTHISALFRLSPEEDPFTQQFWWGLRLAPFAGTGTYKETAGRFNFLYFGPSFGIGNLSRESDDPDDSDESKKSGSSKRPKKKKIPETNAWFLMGGIAAHSRIVEVDPTDDIADKEMNTINSVQLDGPGLWVEFTYANIYFGSLGIHYVAGVQLGEEKMFFWIGAGAGGWY